MRSLDDTDVPNDFRQYLGFGPLNDSGGPVLVFNNDSSADIKTKIETLNVEAVPDGPPAGIGRLIQLPAGRLTTENLLLSQAQSLRGVKGSTILTLDSEATVTDRGRGIGAYITIKDDYRSEDGISGQGVIEDLDIDVNNVEPPGPPGLSKIHGLYAPSPVLHEHANLHTMRNVAVYNANDDGIHFDAGNDKLVCDRPRSEGSGGVGIYLAGGDVKARAVGSVSDGSAMMIVSGAVELDQFDLWRKNFNGDPTLDIVGGANGCIIKSGTVEGWTRFTGKNEDPELPVGISYYLNSRAQFAFVHFKYDANQMPSGDSCYFEARSADLVELVSCKFGGTGNETITTPYTYLIMITNQGDEAGNGLVKISGGS